MIRRFNHTLSKCVYPTLFDEIINTYDNINETNDYTKNMNAIQLYTHRMKTSPSQYVGNVNIDNVFKTIYERDLEKENVTIMQLLLKKNE